MKFLGIYEIIVVYLIMTTEQQDESFMRMGRIMGKSCTMHLYVPQQQRHVTVLLATQCGS